MASIYEITGDYMRLMDMMDDPELDQQTLNDTLEGIEGEFEYKAEAYAKIIKNLESDAEGLKAEIDRLTQRKKAIENNVKRLKMTLQSAMAFTGKIKFKTDLFSFGIQKNAPSVVLETEDLEIVPEEFIKTKYEIDKVAIKDALKAGTELPGVAHLEQGESLRIR